MAMARRVCPRWNCAGAGGDLDRADARAAAPAARRCPHGSAGFSDLPAAVHGSIQTGGIAWRDRYDKPYTLAPNCRRSAGGGIERLLPGGSLALQDELQWTGANEFELLRRTDCCVQVGGHNVSTAWVKEQLLGHFAVQDASVRLDTGAPLSRLKAFVVLGAQGDQSQQASLETWVMHHLP